MDKPIRNDQSSAMRCLVTAGPTIEPLDDVRRLTNFSTGRLGIEFSDFLVMRGHDVRLLLGEQATWNADNAKAELIRFASTADLQAQFEHAGKGDFNAIFHASAVSDFKFGKIWEVNEEGEKTELAAGKISSRAPSLLAELIPTPKLINRLRTWFPQAMIVGWKYEVDGTREDVLAKAQSQVADNSTNLCIANGPAYGEGFGIIDARGVRIHRNDRNALFEALAQMLESDPED